MFKREITFCCEDRMHYWIENQAFMLGLKERRKSSRIPPKKHSNDCTNNKKGH